MHYRKGSRQTKPKEKRSPTGRGGGWGGALAIESIPVYYGCLVGTQTTTNPNQRVGLGSQFGSSQTKKVNLSVSALVYRFQNFKTAQPIPPDLQCMNYVAFWYLVLGMF